MILSLKYECTGVGYKSGQQRGGPMGKLAFFIMSGPARMPVSIQFPAVKGRHFPLHD